MQDHHLEEGDKVLVSDANVVRAAHLTDRVHGELGDADVHSPM